MKPSFIHLHTHSHYSLLNALPKLPSLVQAAKNADMPALALTDNGNLYGAVNFYKECKAQEIKPIIGVDAYVALRTRHDKEPGIDNRRYRIVLLAKNQNGYKNLIKIVTDSHLEGFYYKPRVDHELLAKHSKDLICIAPSFSGEPATHLKSAGSEEAKKKVGIYKDIFGKENVYLELTHHPEIEGHQDLQKKIEELGKDTDTPLVAAHDVYYIKPEDRVARDTLISIQGMAGFRDQGSLTGEEEDFSFISQEQALEKFKNNKEALENTVKIADQCNVEIELGNWLFPKFEISDGSTAEEKFRHIVETGIKRRGIKETKEVRERIEFELKTIFDKGYAPYFLVVSDLMKFAHEHEILSTIRGSVAGSLVTYLAGITTLNPLEYGLPFERFLNPDRPSAPDIDMDFADNRRDEVIDYARQKYGEDKVAQIGTFGTLMARAAVRDTARALGFDYGTGDRIAKIIPFGAQGFPMTFKRALKEEPDFLELYNTDSDTQQIVDMAKKIEGNARHIGVHAAGVVISPIPLNEVVPVQYDTKGDKKIITQYDMHCVEDVGLIKFDFLGLTNLAVLADAIKRVKKLYDVDIDIERIPLDDAKTFKMLADGNTMGVFQLASQAMTAFLKELRPTEIHDINAMVALFRPGPMKNIPEYIARKHGEKDVTYYHPKMEAFLKNSYGILVYQDDLMSTALHIAGYTWKNVDKFRKAVGKKIPEEMARQHDIFVDGCMKHSDMSKAEAEGLWNLFEPFQGYGFNKAHAASYGRVAYQTAYMKANYPHVFMASLLTAEAGDMEKVAEVIVECKKMDIKILPPSANESLGDFTVAYDDDPKDAYGIRFGLHCIKNVGHGIADVIIAERKQNGKYESLADLLERISDRNLNKKSLESLIKCGALDDLGSRGMMLANLDDLLNYSRSTGNTPDSQDSLFNMMEDKSTIPQLQLHEAPPANPKDKLSWEKDLIGLYISGHPLDEHKAKLEEHGVDIATLKEELQPGNKTMVLGVIENQKQITTKAGDHMAFLRIADYSTSLEVVVFPKLYKKCRETLDSAECVAIQGTLSDRGRELSLLADTVKQL